MMVAKMISGKTLGCRYMELHYPDPEDEGRTIRICKHTYWDEKPEALEAYHGKADAYHYGEEEHVIKLSGKWYKIAIPTQCAECFSFYPKNI